MTIAAMAALYSCVGGGSSASADAQAAHALLEETYIKYGEPNSPMRDEDRFIAQLRQLLDNPALADADRERAAAYLETALKNRPVDIAADFAYQLADGTPGTLHTTAANRLLLIFYDPECPHCSDVLQMVDTPITDSRIADGSLSVLAVYTEGNDSVWHANVDKMPGAWTVAIDLDSIVERDIYDIPAMPVLYLLDADKRVILKDASAAALSAVLIQ